MNGNRLTTKEQIVKQADLHLGTSIFGIDVSAIETKLQKLPAVHQVVVQKQYPNKISIHVVEYPVVALLNDHQTLIPLLANGTVLSSHPATSELSALPTFEGWDRERSVLKQVLSQFVHVSPSIRKWIVLIRPIKDKPSEVLLLTSHQHQIEVQIDQLADRMKLYPKFLRQPPGMLHLLDSVWFTPEN